MAKVKPIPDGYPPLVASLTVDGAAEAIEFYTTVFGARERMRMPGPAGTVGHAELEFGESLLMLGDASPEWGTRGPKAIGGSPVSLHLYVEDVDAVFDRAVRAGAKPLRPVENQFYGDRSGLFEDPFGHVWNVSTHVEDISDEEMARRMAEASGG